MPVQILTDSTSDILPREGESRNIHVVPLKVSFGEKCFRDGVDLDHDAFYRELRSHKDLPTTSQPAPEDFLPYFERAKAAGDSLVCLLLSGALSGTVQTALIAKDLCGYEDVTVIDSRNTIVGLRVLVDLACRLRDQGATAKEIQREIEEARNHIALYGLIHTMTYLHKGGRVPAAVALAGTLLKVKPIITVDDGRVELIGKGIGMKGGMKWILEQIGDDPQADPRLPVYFGYSESPEYARQLCAMYQEKYRPAAVGIHSVGAIIGTHVGPRGAVVTYLKKF